MIVTTDSYFLWLEGFLENVNVCSKKVIYNLKKVGLSYTCSERRVL